MADAHGRAVSLSAPRLAQGRCGWPVHLCPPAEDNTWDTRPWCLVDWERFAFALILRNPYHDGLQNQAAPRLAPQEDAGVEMYYYLLTQDSWFDVLQS